MARHKAFPVGAKLRCIDEQGAALGIKEDSIYEVESDDGNTLVLKGNATRSGHWHPRFVLHEEAPVKAPLPKPARTKAEVFAERRTELLDAVVAYHSQGIEVPQEWIEELYSPRFPF